MTDSTKPVSIRLRKSEIDQLQARAYTLSASVTGVARDLIRTGLAGGDKQSARRSTDADRAANRRA
jgi:hypothetical protein